MRYIIYFSALFELKVEIPIFIPLSHEFTSDFFSASAYEFLQYL